jgi:hypothetical protein
MQNQNTNQSVSLETQLANNYVMLQLIIKELIDREPDDLKQLEILTEKAEEFTAMVNEWVENKKLNKYVEQSGNMESDVFKVLIALYDNTVAEMKSVVKQMVDTKVNNQSQ